MNNGMILKIGPKHAVVMNETMELIHLRKKKNMVLGKRIYYTQEDIAKPLLGMGRPLIKAAVAVALVLMLLMVSQLMVKPSDHLYPDAFAVVTVDINPSLELQINNQGRVIEVHALNEDGDVLLSNDLSNLFLNEALEKLLKEAEIHGYLNAEGTVLLTSTQIGKRKGDSADISEIVTSFIDKHLSDYSFMYYEGDQDDLVNAHSSDISVGRYKLNSMVDDEVIDDVTLESMTISEIEQNEKVRAALQGSDSMKVIYRSRESKNDASNGAREQETKEHSTDVETDQGEVHENQFEHKEKDGGGGQNSDNGQQKLGEEYGNGESDHEPEAPDVTTGEALQFRLEEQSEYGGGTSEDSGKENDSGYGTSGDNGQMDSAGLKDRK